MSSIQKLESGRYRARYRDPSGREHAKHFTRKIDARQWLDGATTAITTGQYVTPGAGKITLGQFYDQWAARQVWVTGTVQAMRLAVDSSELQAVPLRDLHRSHIESWVKRMAAKGLAPGTVATRVNNVRAVLRAAVRDRIIPADPSDGVVLPRRRRKAAAMTIPTPEDVGKILHAADQWFQPFVGLCAFAGLRLGEAAAVQSTDIDFLRRQLSVTRQVQRAGKGTVEIRAPKYGSERVVYLADGLVDMLSRHVRDIGTRPGGWMFVGIGDMPPHQNTVGYWWRKTLVDAGMSGVKLHDLRHFYASGLIAQGCDVVTVQRALGHASATTTLSTYSHLWPTAEDRTRRAAGALMVESLPELADYLRTVEA